MSHGKQQQHGDNGTVKQPQESKKEEQLKEAAKKIYFLVARPLRPYPPPHSLELSSHIFSDFLSPLNGRATKKTLSERHFNDYDYDYFYINNIKE